MKIAIALVEGDRMKNLRILLADHPGSLAAMAETLGSAGISIEGGGMFVADGKGIANFLVENGPAARRALEAAGIEVIGQDDVVIQRLNQDEPGQLGKLLRRMAQANVNVVTQYSDHNHQLVLVVDDAQAAQAVSDAWMKERSARGKARTTALPAKTRSHHYEVNVLWTGNKGAGTSGYMAYERSHDISSAQKVVIGGSSDPAFRGDGTRYNPEELLVASASACHMLSYLHLCAVNGVVVVSYEDQATGEMEEVIGGPGAFVQVDLHPMVTISAASDALRAEALHKEAHKNCFIANSLKVPVITHPMVVRHSEDQ
jgi:organic hydroperoxide reductase OsmC/OhrA